MASEITCLTMFSQPFMYSCMKANNAENISISWRHHDYNYNRLSEEFINRHLTLKWLERLIKYQESNLDGDHQMPI